MWRLWDQCKSAGHWQRCRIPPTYCKQLMWPACTCLALTPPPSCDLPAGWQYGCPQHPQSPSPTGTRCAVCCSHPCSPRLVIHCPALQCWWPTRGMYLSIVLCSMVVCFVLISNERPLLIQNVGPEVKGKENYLLRHQLYKSYKKKKHFCKELLFESSFLSTITKL